MSTGEPTFGQPPRRSDAKPIDTIASPDRPIMVSFIKLDDEISDPYARLYISQTLREKKKVYFIPHPDLDGTVFVTTELSDGTTIEGLLITVEARKLFPENFGLSDQLERGLRLQIDPSKDVGRVNTFQIDAIGLVKKINE